MLFDHLNEIRDLAERPDGKLNERLIAFDQREIPIDDSDVRKYGGSFNGTEITN